MTEAVRFSVDFRSALQSRRRVQTVHQIQYPAGQAHVQGGLRHLWFGDDRDSLGARSLRNHRGHPHSVSYRSGELALFSR